MTTTSEVKIICSGCAAQLPVSEFRRRKKGSEARMTKCRQCHAGYERVRRQNIRRKQNGIDLQKAATKITRYRSFDRIENLIELMVSRFGGPAELWDFWKAEINRVETQKKVTLRALRFIDMCLALGRLFPLGVCPHDHRCGWQPIQQPQPAQPGALLEHLLGVAGET